MESDTIIYWIYISNTDKIIIVRKSDFKVQKNNPLPGVAALIDEISRQLHEEEAQGSIAKSD